MRTDACFHVAFVGLASLTAILIGAAPPGTWAPLELQPPRSHNYRLADLEAAQVEVRQVDAIFRRDKALDPPPAGMLVEPGGDVGTGPPPQQVPYRRDVVPAFYAILFLHPSEMCRDGACRIVKGEGEGVHVYINRPYNTLFWSDYQSPPFGEPHDAQTLYFAPRQVGTVGGYPLYENGYVVMTHRTQPIWVAVSREDFVRARIVRLRGKLPPASTPAYKSVSERIAALDRELAAMPGADRAAPAYCCAPMRDASPSGMASGAAPPARAVVRLNKDFFDPSLPGSAVQLLVVGTAAAYDREYGGNASERQHPFFADVQNGLDWGALAQLLR